MNKSQKRDLAGWELFKDLREIERKFIAGEITIQDYRYRARLLGSTEAEMDSFINQYDDRA